MIAEASNSLSNLIAGVLFRVVVMLPTGAIPGKVAEDVLFRLGLVTGPVAEINRGSKDMAQIGMFMKNPGSP